MRKYENPKCTSENRLPQRAYYIPENEGGFISLNGDWDFKYYECDFEEDYVEKDWERIDVPSCWQSRGYENPNYANVAYPYPCDKPYVPDRNPMGIYKRTFDIADADRETYIVFEGVSSTHEVYVNGEYVGFSQGSHLQSEFCLTPYVKNGENTLLVKVRKWCSGSYLEDQDCFRYNGIFRDVYLLSRPEGHIKDIKITTKDNCINVEFDGSAKLTLKDRDGNLLDKKYAEKSAVFTVENPVLWNAEKPYLYELGFEYEDEIITQKVGFVAYSIGKDREFLVNGVEVKLKGVNHHDTHPVNGWTVTEGEMRTDLELMKKLNINTIRTAHYPPPPKFISLCDELGFYVMVENDIETHGFNNRLTNNPCSDSSNNPAWPCSDPDWNGEFVERMLRTYGRDKNHTSVFAWSAGNESAFGQNHVDALLAVKKLNPERLTHYEGATSEWLDPGHATSGIAKPEEFLDLYSHMYPSIENITEKYLKDENIKISYFMCEYAHAMGNGPGDVCDYWDVIYNNKNFIGGCVWEWIDHTVLVNGVPKYGGDFEGEITHDSNFCCDGMLFYDKTFKAGTYEIKAAYQYMRCELAGDKVKVTNLYDFTNLKEYTFRYEVKADGEVISSEELTLDIEPKASCEILVKLPTECTLGAFVNCYLLDGDEVVAKKQLSLPVAVKKAEDTASPVTGCEDAHFITFAGDGFEYKLSKDLGTFVSMVKNGEEQLLEPVRLSVWRALTDNDTKLKDIWEWQNPYTSENFNKVFNKTYSCTLSGNTVTVEGSLGAVSRLPLFKYTAKYSVFADGRVDVVLDGKVRENCVWLPRLGYEFKTPYENDKFRYFGMGKLESYCDMNHWSMIDWYDSDADSEYVPYIRPQEHGNHTCTKVLEMRDGLCFASEKGFDMNVSHIDSLALHKARHQDEIVKSNGTIIRIDYKNSGVGSAACGPDLAPRYRLDDKEIHFEFSIR